MCLSASVLWETHLDKKISKNIMLLSKKAHIPLAKLKNMTCKNAYNIYTNLFQHKENV